MVTDTSASSRATPAVRGSTFVSVCSPVHNELGNLNEFVARVSASLEGAGYTKWEAVLVDDGSTDGSGALLDKIAASNSHVRVVHHERNMGEWAAWKTAFANSEGDVVCMLASDLQPPPEALPALIDLVAVSGFDVGTGRRADRQDHLFYRQATRLLTLYSNIFWGLRVRDVSSSFFAVRGNLARRAKMLKNDHRYILAIFKSMGASIAEVDTVSHKRRQFGQSHYKKSKVIKSIPEVLRFTFRLLCNYYSRSRKTLEASRRDH